MTDLNVPAASESLRSFAVEPVCGAGNIRKYHDVSDILYDLTFRLVFFHHHFSMLQFKIANFNLFPRRFLKGPL